MTRIKRIKLFLFALVGLAVLAAQPALQAQTFQDHTKVRALTGKVSITAAEIPSCPVGQVLSGGVCVVIPNQSTPYDPAWTKYFSGQTRCVWLNLNPGWGPYTTTCAQINSDSSVTVTCSGHPYGTAVKNYSPANGRNQIDVTTTVSRPGRDDQANCTFAYIAPIFSSAELSSGLPPGNWVIRQTMWSEQESRTDLYQYLN